jgi:signal transduction histidine kinase
MLDEYEDVISQKHIVVTVEKSSTIKTYANKTLIEVLIGNLLSNAIRHNVDHGTIRIALNEKELVIENSGAPRALNAIDIVKRFHKASSDQRSLGLGLEIIDKICTLNRYALKYHYSEGMHSFAIRF